MTVDIRRHKSLARFFHAWSCKQSVERGIWDNGMAAIGNHVCEHWEHWEHWGQCNPMAVNENGNF